MIRPRYVHPHPFRAAVSLLVTVGAVLAMAGPAAAQGEETGAQGNPLLFTVPAAPAPIRPAAPSTAPLPPLPDVYTQPVGPFALYAEVIASGPSEYGLEVGPSSCVQSSIFRRGMKMVWRFEVYELGNGMRLNDRDGTEATIMLTDGTAIPAHFSKRGGPAAPPDNPWMWAGTWSIPPDYALGPLTYSIKLNTADGRSATLRPPVITATWPLVID